MYSYSTNHLIWPTSYSSYSKLTGGYTPNGDSGSSTNSINIPLFYMNGTSFTELKFGTDGTINFQEPPYDGGEGCPPGEFDSGSTIIQQINGNVGDLEIIDDSVLTDGDVSGCYYKTSSTGSDKYAKLLVVVGTYSGQEPASFLVNLYRDTSYQWIEVLIKSGLGDELNPASGCRVGPYNAAVDVSQEQSNISMVWRGSLNGTNWEYMGTGSVIALTESTCSPLSCDTPSFKCYVGTSNSCTCARWKYFTAQCTRNQQALGICNGTSGAYVPAITVCNQRLF